MGLNRLRIDDNKDKITYNILFSWGRGDCGALGHGDAKTSSLPRSIDFFRSMRVLQRRRVEFACGLGDVVHTGSSRAASCGCGGTVFTEALKLPSQIYRPSIDRTSLVHLEELLEHKSLTSDSFRILYRCGPCKIDALCIACAHRCHIQHCLELTWTISNALSRECDCFYSGKCTFDNDGGRQEDSD
uniref:Uncharacterized protein n=1 Tax=Globisporangium ultimum (strain ATCC 200006 / CBS 805.95 / DAOM BR144) TaxID=431595 RepID=K3WJQ1_GLOUD